MLRGLYDTVQEAMALTVQAVRDANVEAAERVLAMRETVALQSGALLERQAGRLRPDDPDYLLLARLQMSIVDKLERIYDLAARAAHGMLPKAAPLG
jgi:Na+/phosphate symporter